MCADGFLITDEATCTPPTANQIDTYVAFRAKYVMDLKDRNGEMVSINDIVKRHESMITEKISNYGMLLIHSCVVSLDVVLNVSMNQFINDTLEPGNTSIWDNVDHLESRLELGVRVESNITVLVELINEILTLDTFQMAFGEYFNITHQTMNINELNTPTNDYLTGELFEIRDFYDLSLPGFFKVTFILNAFHNAKDQVVVSFLQNDESPCVWSDYNMEIWPSPFKARVEILFNEETRLKKFIDYKRASLNSIFTSSFSCPVIINQGNTGILVCYDEYTEAFTIRRKANKSISIFTDIASWLSLGCICLSILSLIMTLSVYISLPILRGLPGLNNMALVTSLALYQVFYLISHSRGVEMFSNVCLLSAVATHLFLLNFACWMLIATFHAARAFNVNYYMASKTDVNKKFMRSCLLSIVLSATFVLANIFSSLVNSMGGSIGYGTAPCYIRESSMILFTVAVPVGIVIILNMIMFFFTAVTFCRLPNVSSNSNRNFQKIKVMAKLSTITGISWTFGYLYQLTHYEVFAYLFIVFNAGMGVFIFFSFVMTKRIWLLLKERRDTFSNVTKSSMFAKTSITKVVVSEKQHES